MLWTLLLLLPLLLLVALYAAALHSRRAAPDYGLVDGHLRPCPPTPNCAGSEPGTAAERRLPPLPFGAHPAPVAWERLQQAIAAAGGQVVVAHGDYLAATFRTPWLGFVDDVEARLEPSARVIYLRSASRVGRSDFGANRARLARLARQYADPTQPD
jgi:uncharacterized protein (DUF1499 family)